MDTGPYPPSLEEAPRVKVQQILCAAGPLFMEQGYGAVSMDAIARKAGVSKATLYAHFAGKEELFGAIIAAACARHATTLGRPDAGPDSGDHDIGDGLRRFARNFLETLLSPNAAAIYRIVIGEGPRFPELGRIFYESGPRLTLDRLSAYLGEADARGHLRVPEPRAAAEHFTGMMKGEAHLRRLLGIGEKPSAEEIDRVVDLAVGAFLRAYAA
jgi:TetR/AcrR family transcriptional repressor of mexJK operon